MRSKILEEYLPDLHYLIKSIEEEISAKFRAGDIELPEELKHIYEEFAKKEGCSAEFSRFSFKFINKQGQIVIGSNQWFQLAAYSVPLYISLEKYRDVLVEIYGTQTEVKKIYTQVVPKKKEGGIEFQDSDQEAEEFLDQVSEKVINYGIPSTVMGDKHQEFLDTCKSFFQGKTNDSRLVEKWVSNMNNFFTDLSWWKGGKELFRHDFAVSPILGTLNLINASHEFIVRLVKFLVASDEAQKYLEDLIGITPINIIEPVPETENGNRKTGGVNLIMYGAPGTGKSYTLERRFGSDRTTVRIVFHSSYTYYDFVGTYKPVPLYEKVDTTLFEFDGTESNKGNPHIDYQFVPGPFIQVLMKAFMNPENMHTLIIEEINRADAAAVFGELFQLMDRSNDGTSIYKIAPSKELKTYLSSIETLRPYISSGLYLPSNMNIVATMNSADQGVNLLDSAFKRRWSFEYLSIDFKPNLHANIIRYAGEDYTWGNILVQINEKLKTQLKVNEDRLLGPYFLSPAELNDEKSIHKVLLYLWSDVLQYKREQFFSSNIHTINDLINNFPTKDVLEIKDLLDSVKQEGE